MLAEGPANSKLEGIEFVQRAVANLRDPACCIRTVSSVTLALCVCLCGAGFAPGATVKNIARSGDPLLGVAVNLTGSNDQTVVNQGPIEEINDGVVHHNLAPDAYIINGDGQSGASGNGADTYAPSFRDHLFDFAGVLFSGPQFGVTTVRVQNYLANDGGWWGPTNIVAGGTPLSPNDLAAPLVQVTFNGGSTWSSVVGVESDYVQKYTGAVRGTGFPLATSGPLAKFNFPAQDGINGIRLIGNGGGPADGNGFIGVSEFEAWGIAQELSLEVNTATGMVRLANNVQTPIELDFYRITSAANSLDVDGWNSLADPRGNLPGFPSGDGSGNGWESLGNLGTEIVAEAFLQGASSIPAGETVNLGFAFAGGVQDLMLRYRTKGGEFVDVAAVSIAGLAGDFDWDGDVDGRDFLAWQRGESPNPQSSADLAAWQSGFGAPSGAAVATVPEPNTVVMLLISAAASTAHRTGTSRSCLAGPDDRNL